MKYTILCVEDDEATQAVLSAALREFSPQIAATGADAVRHVNTDAYDAFVLDLWLPDYNGVPLVREIRRLDPHVPILFWTVADKAQLEPTALRAGADAYIQKSGDYDELRATLARLIEAADQRAAAASVRAQEVLDRARYSGTDVRADSVAYTVPASPADRRKREVCATFLDAGGTLSRFERWWRSAVAARV
jgi:DNA-binding response OmpR family regulator